ncbi:MAG TPA: 1-(5-phosphoribosyl)-5-[(5-phosphoribosylamino)methylideneamino]imidazole-4-carboxamide isomerase [Pyrinomonadaceae bacterium]|nr:1-(5-phosphoribosyl)-5-[(5-phosphoribosylamino)methylideneamino]imidazole-4-carboxamide isomerase [Pyrinomonadaceae bacterium]
MPLRYVSMLIIPAIDLKSGHCVRLSQGRRAAVKIYEEDPTTVAQHFADAGARMLHVVDLDAAFGDENTRNTNALLRILRTVDVPVQFGGGVRKREDIRRLIDAGVSRIVLGTIAVESTEILEELAEEFGPKVCVGIDARDGHVLVRGWETTTDMTATDLAKRAAAAGVARIIYTDTARDGMLTGPNIEQTIAVARAAQLRVTASGGISSLDDIRSLLEANESLLDSVIVGKALYEKRFSLEDALRLAVNNG